MSITGTQWRWFGGSASEHTAEVNFPPADIGATATLFGIADGGLHMAGIKSYRRRLPSGEDERVDFQLWWPPAVADRASSVTFAIANGRNQWTNLVGRLDFYA
jgi:hypothetical protein